ncbi:hypothetical protein D3C84_1089230 [compost metagenome]
MATLQIAAMSTRLRMRPKRSASTDSGKASTPTAMATTLDSAPSSESERPHSALRCGKTTVSTCRDMKSDSSRPKVRAKTTQA